MQWPSLYPAIIMCSIAWIAHFPLAYADDPDRQAAVSALGPEVMPFSLSATAHIFSKTPSGAIQQVVVKDPLDRDQVSLIRQHLKEVAAQFRRGDFSGPSHVHGAQMPGLAELMQAKPGEIAIQYQDLQLGGQIQYSAHNPALVAALHRWVDAQLADHGPDAMEGHEHHHDPINQP
jgi:hypothetical protein